MTGDRDMVHECTSANFDGLIAVMKPSESWTARWQGICARTSHHHVPHPRPRPSPSRRARLTPSGCSPEFRFVLMSIAATFVPGCYALRVKGVLNNQHITTLQDNGIRYRPLDEEQS
jgi:hypothetical protein